MNTEQVFFGMSVGVLLGLFLFLWVNEIGRDECEKHLPRTQKCVKVWVPQPVPSTEKEAA